MQENSPVPLRPAIAALAAALIAISAALAVLWREGAAERQTGPGDWRPAAACLHQLVFSFVLFTGLTQLGRMLTAVRRRNPDFSFWQRLALATDGCLLLLIFAIMARGQNGRTYLAGLGWEIALLAATASACLAAAFSSGQQPTLAPTIKPAAPSATDRTLSRVSMVVEILRWLIAAALIIGLGWLESRPFSR